ncbi:hypothetical protein [Silvanigrella aquatica]|uniref:Uncharacterized protein n=1 Tax=Silvanigrella aquatica TaxID=1915309 RepID=A0A1L4D1K2_9BACT|nr:hypothetical protein [Silvanigrella aquatica]APJ04070.1 hypothetical protein AXG55_09190 [Silvanigrella aquatica]
MQNFSKIKNKNTEQGQSLVEMIFILPLFFIALGGFIILFQQQIRGFSDEMTQSALAVSEASFFQEERSQGLWESGSFSSSHLMNSIAFAALNPSSAFQSSVDMKRGVFADKKPLKQALSSSHKNYCSFDALFDVVGKEEGSFELTTCAAGSAYESLNSHLAPIFEEVQQTYLGNFIYVPPQDFLWEKRSSEPSREAVSYMLSPGGILFSKNQASLFIPDTASFNTKCYMEPFSPHCDWDALGGKFSRAALDAAKLQLSACLAEAVATCLATGAALPVCTVAKGAEIAASLAVGKEAIACSKVNSILKASQKMVHGTVFAYSSIKIAQETAIRGEILINK